MIGTSTPEYIFIRFCVYLLHYIAPICILYTFLVISFYGTSAAFYRFPLLIESIALAETLFFLLVYIPYRRYLQREAIHPPPLSRAERYELFQLCNKNIADPEKYLRKWFLGAPLEEIKRENLKDFFLWAFFNRGGVPGDDDEELNEYVNLTEKMLGKKIEDGRGMAVPLRLTLDRVDMMHRSLIWYFCVGFVDLLTYTKLLYHGFHFHRTSLKSTVSIFPFRPQALTTSYRSPAKHTTYWHRAHTSTTKLPIVFIHGIGIGLYPYTNFFSELNDTTDDTVGILAIEILPVSFRLCHAPLPKAVLISEINSILLAHSFSKFVLVSHSYGTIISTALLKSPEIAPKIAATVLVDPVSILLHLPDVAYNFTRRKPVRANEWQLFYFASMDIGVSHTLGRHFFWADGVLWKGDVGGKDVTICLASDDLIVDTLACGRYLMDGNEEGNLLDLDEEGTVVRNRADGKDGDGKDDGDKWKRRTWTGKGIDVLWFDGLDHAQVFDDKRTRGQLIRVIREYSNRG